MFHVSLPLSHTNLLSSFTQRQASHDVHGCVKPVNTHGLDIVRHDGRFLAGCSTLELQLTAQ